MAKWTKVGFIANRKDGKGKYFKIETQVTLKKDQYLNVTTRPTDAQVEEAEGKAKERLQKAQTNWPDWKVAEVVLVENDAE